MRDSEMKKSLETLKRIAVVGLSPEPSRASYAVTEYMIQQGYEVTGVRPGMQSILGRPCVDSVARVQGGLEIVNVFRSPDHLPALVEELIPLNPVLVWLQLGVVHAESESRLKNAGIQVVSDRCLMVEHRRLFRN